MFSKKKKKNSKIKKGKKYVNMYLNALVFREGQLISCLIIDFMSVKIRLLLR